MSSGTPLLFLRTTMKILFTGMASSHCKRPSNVTFFSTLSDIVSEFAEVVWAAPKLSWTKEDLDSFDLIVFGLTPPTALSANKIYGAMHVLGLMYHSPKLRLVVDSQQVWQYKNSLEAIKRDVNNLFSPFFAKKFGYLEAKNEKRKYIDLASSYMASDYWPKTYYPSLPWNTDEKAASSLGFVPADRLKGLNLDSMLILSEPYSMPTASSFWSVEDERRSWYSTIRSSITLPAVDVRLSKTMDDQSAANLIRQSVGLIVPPQDRKVGTWWSYKYLQAINSNIPVITLWQESSALHESWSYLAYQIEDMSESERRLVARNQLESYCESVPTKGKIIEEIRQEMVDLPKERI